jgi:hypothetical protein
MTPEAQDPHDSPTWPRTADGHCACPLCTAIRSGQLKAPDTQSAWARRMGATQ